VEDDRDTAAQPDRDQEIIGHTHQYYFTAPITYPT
jgi:hypothetical protein